MRAQHSARRQPQRGQPKAEEAMSSWLPARGKVWQWCDLLWNECTATTGRRPNPTCIEQRQYRGGFGFRKILQRDQVKAREGHRRGEFLFCARTTHICWHDRSYRRIGSDYRHQLWATVKEPRLGETMSCATGRLEDARPRQQAPHEDNLTCTRSIPKGESRRSIPRVTRGNDKGIMPMS